MASEGMPTEGARERNLLRIDAIRLFDNDLKTLLALGFPLSYGDVEPLVRSYLSKTFNDLSHEELDATIKLLERIEDIPNEDFLYEDPAYALEWMRGGLYDLCVTLYALKYSQDEFHEWLEPFTRFSLAEHTNETPGHDVDKCHWKSPRKDKPCPIGLMRSMLLDQMSFQEGSIKGHEEHIFLPEETVKGNVRQVRLLAKFGGILEVDARELIDNYEDWLDSVKKYNVTYDKSIFDLNAT